MLAKGAMRATSFFLAFSMNASGGILALADDLRGRACRVRGWTRRGAAMVRSYAERGNEAVELSKNGGRACLPDGT